MAERRAAAIDIGTNSVLLTIAERSPSGLRALEERATITRLGQGVDRTRRLTEAAAERTLACLAEYAAVIRAAGVSALDVVGTSALRDAAGAEEFLSSAERLLGVRPRVIEGEEEARLTFLGAISGLDVSGPLLVFDVGGGSTEFIYGVRARALDAGEPRVEHAQSLDIGSVRLHERHVSTDPPTAAQSAAIREDVRRELARLPQPPGAATLIGVAGTITTLAAMHARLEHYDATAIHGSTLEASVIHTIARQLEHASLRERQQLPGLEPQRADVIFAGALLTLEVLAWARHERLCVSDRGVRWGLLQALLAVY